MKFKIGDLVTPKPAFVGHKNIFIIEAIDLRDRTFKLKLFSDVTKTKNNIPQPDIRWKEDELIIVEPEYHTSVHTRVTIPISDKIQKITVGENSLNTDYIKQTIDNLYPTVEPINPFFEHWEVQENKINKEEKEMFKILEMYENKKRKEIDDRYDRMIQNIIEDDEIQNIIKEMENQVRTIAGTKANEYCFNYPGLYEERTEKALKELDEEKMQQRKELSNKIKSINALLELAPNYEEKLRILRDYEIMDKKKNIIL